MQRWRAAPAASSQRGPPRASGSGQGLPPAPNAITALSNGPAWTCPSSSGAGGIHGLSRRAFASVCLRPARRLASRQEPQPPRAALRRPLRVRDDARGRNAPARKKCANRRRRGRTAHVQPLPAVREGRPAPAAAVMARRVVTGLLLLEAAGLLGALLLYRAMDRSQDFRYTMQKRFPSILEVYYKSNEWSGIHGIRENDQMTWLSSKN
ncbi:protein CEBPZOS [Aptenodytes patagonicus]|uniref:protein CEBPZOS n=1 Tax=Aptenodytes patagonicus TaxID=9234 RepID=UPI003FA15E82